MREGEHWIGWPPDDPPLCNHIGDCDCEPPDEVGVDEPPVDLEQEFQKAEQDYIRRHQNDQ